MSFILDALKKSEAERRLGQTPSLKDTDQAILPSRRKSSWLWPLGAVLLIAVVVVWGWKQFMGAEQASEPAVAEVVATPAPQNEVVHEYRSPAAAAAIKAREQQSPITNYTPPLPTPIITSGPDLPAAGTTPAIDTTSAAASVPAGSQAPVELSDAEQQKQRIEKFKQQRAAEADEDAALVAAVESRLATEAASAKEDTENSVRFRELPAAVRSSMPDIKISTQVYSVTREDRFAIINGKRYRESETLADGVLLDEILRRGVIVKYKQYRVLIGD